MVNDANPDPLNVLVVEDSLMNRQLAMRVLQAQGHAVTLARNGREALERVRSQHFDVVLMDVEMPEMDGLAATRAIRLRELRQGTHLPIVALTSSLDIEACLDAGMDAYLEKPLSGPRLSTTLQALLAV